MTVSSPRPSGTLDLDALDEADNELFNEAARQARRPFDALMAELLRPHVDDVDWMLSGLASRNKFQSALFERCCRLTFVNLKLAKGSPPSSIRVADRALADALRRRLRQEHPGISVRCTETPRQRAWRVTRPLRQAAITAATFLLRWAGRRRPSLSASRPLVLIDTFVLNVADAGGIVDGVYKDRYYPGLLEALTPQERDDIHFLPTIIGFRNPIVAFRRIRSAQTRFLVHDDYLKLKDYFVALTSGLRFLRARIPDLEYQGYEVGPLLREDRRRHFSDLNSLVAHLYFRFAKRLADAGVRVRLLIDWNENQVIDRALVAGFHRFHPAAKVVGYQGYVPAKDLLVYTRPTTTEMRAGAIPDVIAVTGHGLRDDVREFAPDLRVIVAPGFRFQRLWAERRQSPNPDAFTVLVGLPIDLEDSAYILGLLMREPRLVHSPGLRVVVKPHPTYSPERIRNLLPAGRFPSAWQFATGSFYDALETANLLVGNASSTCLEALAKGVPVIVIAPQTGIVPNVIPETIDHAMWAVCRGIQQTAAAIDRFRCASREQLERFETQGRDIRAAYFEPVSREGVERFLDLGTHGR